MTAATARGGICVRGSARARWAAEVIRLLAFVSAIAAGLASPDARAQQSDASATAAAGAKQSASETPFDVKFSAAVTNDYIYRGYTLSDHLPSVSNNIEATYGILFFSANQASVQIPALSRFQMTDTIGIRPVFGALTLESGAAYYSYPGSQTDESYPEFYVAPSYAVSSRLNVGLNVYYAPNYYRTGAWENYDSLTAKFDLGSGLSLSGEVGRQRFGTTAATPESPPVQLPAYTYWNFGFTYTYNALSFDLRYNATSLSRQSCFLITGTGNAIVGSNGCDPTLVATLTWSAGLSDFKSAFSGSK
jgi:uncharacterized protein (TIGR02001 family)